MRGRHHASSEASVTYKPKPEDAHPGGDAGGRVDLAYSAICHFCGVTHISVIKPFPIPYRCATCAAAQEAEPAAPTSTQSEVVVTPAHAVLLARVEKISEGIIKLGDRITAERVRRDDLFLKGQAQGLSSRQLAVPAQMTSPGVCSAIARAKERTSTKEEA